MKADPLPSSNNRPEDPVIGHVNVTYAVPVTKNQALKWSTPSSDWDPEDDRWIFEVEEAVKDRLPDLLETSGEPTVEWY